MFKFQLGKTAIFEIVLVFTIIRTQCQATSIQYHIKNNLNK